jgi:hypothetical protein
MAATFSDFGRPEVDGQAVNRYFVPMLLRNVVQGLQQVDGRGVTEEFTQDVEALELRIVRQKPIQGKVRSLAGQTNNNLINNGTAETHQSAYYGLKITEVYDLPFDIFQLGQDMFKVDLLDSALYNMSQYLKKNLNASTMATQIAAALNLARSQTAGSANKTHFVNSSLTDDTGANLNSLLSAFAILDNGDTDHDQDTFDYLGRCALVRSEFKRSLPKGVVGILNIGNYRAQNMLKYGGADPDTRPNNVSDGLFGDIDSTPHYMTSAPIWNLAASYIAYETSGLPVGANVLDDVHALITHAKGTLRGLAFARSTKIVDTQPGQGRRIQPLYRWGHEVIFDKSIVLLGNKAALVTLVDTTLTDDVVAVGPGSHAS